MSDDMKQNSKFLCGLRKGHSPFQTPIGSLYTFHFVYPFILMLRLMDHKLCFDYFTVTYTRFWSLHCDWISQHLNNKSQIGSNLRLILF